MFNGLFDIVFFALIAVFLAFRLYSVLGRKNEGEGAPERLSKYLKGQQKGVSGNVITLPLSDKAPVPAPVQEEPAFSAALPVALLPTLQSIHAKDGNFTEKKFLQGALSAFDVILAAFCKGDKTALQALVGKELYQDFAQEIDNRKNAGEQLDITIAAILSREITDATLRKNTASVTVKIASEQICVVRNMEGEIISGNPSHVELIDDSWTFSRDLSASNPNWQLVSTNP